MKEKEESSREKTELFVGSLSEAATLKSGTVRAAGLAFAF